MTWQGQSLTGTPPLPVFLVHRAFLFSLTSVFLELGFAEGIFSCSEVYIYREMHQYLTATCKKQFQDDQALSRHSGFSRYICQRQVPFF